MQCTLSGRKKTQLAIARFLAVSAARNDTAYRVDATDAHTCVRELRPESLSERSVSWDAKQLPARSGHPKKNMQRPLLRRAGKTFRENCGILKFAR
jgi:hypothetical protein